jgi:hypothetical protein
MSDTTKLSQLIGDADLDQAATDAMQLTADTLGPAIMAQMGNITLDDITTAEALLVTLIVDDSWSIEASGNTQALRDGVNGLIDALQSSKQSASVLVSCRTLNDGLVYPYVMLENAPLLDNNNFRPMGGTPLFRETAVALSAVAAKMAEFEQGGVAARAVTAIVTDGGDNASGRITTNDIKAMVNSLLKTELHIVAGMGIDDGYTDFRAVFQDMGVRDEWVLTPGNTPSEIRKAFQVVSQSAVRASQTAGSFSQTALGGFNS